MAIEKHDRRPDRQRLPFPAVLVIAALAIFGAITAVQWALASLLGIVKFGLVLVIVVGVAAWVVSVKGNR